LIQISARQFFCKRKKNLAMKRKTYFLLAALLVGYSASAQTNVSGFINANTTWNLAGSPYIVVGNALLSNGYTLTIDPGVVVKFDPAKALQIDGELHAIGTAANKITFTSNQVVPAPGDWAKIHFPDLSIDAVLDTAGNYLSGSIMKYCDVMYGGGSGFGEIHLVNSSPYFSHCIISHSANDGIYCQGSSSRLDSSTVKNCNGAGLSGGGLTIVSDSILSNLNGGIYSGSAILITKNYFSGNQQNGAILGVGNANAKIIENVFVSNIATGNSGIVNAGGTNCLISKNYFLNNSANFAGNGILHVTGWNQVIECNRFVSNHTGTNGRGALDLYLNGNSFVRGNLIEDNTGNNYSVCASYIQGITASHITFSDNIIRNNSCPLGKISHFEVLTLSGQEKFLIHNNAFTNNTADTIIDVSITFPITSTDSFFDMKLNHLDNPAASYELYNRIPYGSPNLYVDSNYWGSNSTQHIDSVIYDYFDDATKSVVYYPPFLPDPPVVDTLCIPPVITSVTNLIAETFTSTIFPNPFTATATITFGEEISAGRLCLYNMFGQMVQEKNNIYGGEIILTRENLGSGVYVYEVTDKEKKICTGKAVVY